MSIKVIALIEDVMRKLIMDEPLNFNLIKGLAYCGLLKSNVKVGEKVIIVLDEKECVAVVNRIDQFNKTLTEGHAGEEVGLFFQWKNELLNGRVRIYKESENINEIAMAD